MIVYQNTSHLGCFHKKCKAAEQNSENGARLLSTDSQATFGPEDVRFPELMRSSGHRVPVLNHVLLASVPGMKRKWAFKGIVRCPESFFLPSVTEWLIPLAIYLLMYRNTSFSPKESRAGTH